MRLLIALFALASVAFGSACSTTQAGNWSSASTWTSCSGGVPGSGDTFTAGHAVTVDVNTTVGTSPSDGTTIIGTINAAVTVAAGKTWTMRGSVHWNASVILQAGASWVLDPTQASTRTAAIYKIGPTDYYKNAKLDTTACTSGARCAVKTLRTNGDEGRAYFTLNGYVYEDNLFDVRYTDFTDLGASDTFAIDSAPYTFSPGAKTFDIRYSTFTRCGPIHVGGAQGDAVIRFNYNTLADSLGTWNLAGAGYNALSTGTREIVGNYFDKQLGGTDPYGTFLPGSTITGNILAGGMRLFSITSLFTRNVIFSSTPDIWVLSDISNTVVINDQADNPHFLYTNPSPVTTLTYDGVILEYAGAGVDGDGLNVACSTCTSLTIRNSLVLRSATSSDHATSTLASFGGAVTNGPISVYHNTMAGGNPAGFNHGIFYNECPGACTPAATIAAYKSNLSWFDTIPTVNNPPVGPGANHFQYQGSPANNVLVDGAATNNTCWNCVAATVSGPSNGTMYNVPLAAGQTIPGANDRNVDPGFVDPTRTVETWAATKGQAATLAGAKTALAAGPAAMIPDLLAYLRAGYAPKNLSFATAGHDGAQIGAVAPILMFGTVNQ